MPWSHHGEGPITPTEGPPAPPQGTAPYTTQGSSPAQERPLTTLRVKNTRDTQPRQHRKRTGIWTDSDPHCSAVWDLQTPTAPENPIVCADSAVIHLLTLQGIGEVDPVGSQCTCSSATLMPSVGHVFSRWRFTPFGVLLQSYPRSAPGWWGRCCTITAHDTRATRLSDRGLPGAHPCVVQYNMVGMT